MTDRCEPPEHLRGVVGWHWVGKPGDEFSEKPYLWGHRRKWMVLGRGSPEIAYAHGWRYICPIPTPSELAAAKEREAVLVAALKDIAGAGVYSDGLLSNPALARLTLTRIFPGGTP